MTRNSKMYLFQNYLAYCFIIIKVLLLIILCIPLLKKPFRFLQFQVNLLLQTLSFQGSVHSPNPKVLGVTLLGVMHDAAFWCSFVT